MDSTPLAKTAESAGPPAFYSTVAEEYRALKHGAALLDRSSLGRLSYAGEDALDLVQRLSTNDLLPLRVGDGAATVLTTHKGRIVDLLTVVRRADDLLVITSPESRQAVIDHIDFYTFAEDVTVTDLTEETAMLSVAGPRAARVVDGLADADVAPLARFGSLSVRFGAVEALIVRTDFVGLPAFDVIVSAEHAGGLWRDLLDRGTETELKPVGTAAREAVRVERGVPAFGTEMGESYNPHEADLLEFVSFTKGCYVGQEVVTRLDTYKKVQKRLVGLALGFNRRARSRRRPLPRRQTGRGRHLAGKFARRRRGHRPGLRPHRAGPGRHGAVHGGRRRRCRCPRGRAALHPLRVYPPSTTITCPRIISASSLHRKATARAMSTPVTMRPTGLLLPAARISSRPSK